MQQSLSGLDGRVRQFICFIRDCRSQLGRRCGNSNKKVIFLFIFFWELGKILEFFGLSVVIRPSMGELCVVLLCVLKHMILGVCWLDLEKEWECIFFLVEYISLVCVASGPALHWLLQEHLTPGRHNGKSVVHVVADQVADASKPVVFGAHLMGKYILLYYPCNCIKLKCNASSSSPSYHSLWVDKKQMLGLTPLLSCKDVLPRRGPRLSHQEVSISGQQSLCFFSTQTTVEPDFVLQLLHQRGRYHHWCWTNVSRHSQSIVERFLKRNKHICNLGQF